VRLTADDQIRQQLISELICHFFLNYQKIEQTFGIVFEHYFALELASLDQMEQDRLLIRESNQLRVLPKGKLLIRNICMQFDFYQRQKERPAFSKLI